MSATRWCHIIPYQRCAFVFDGFWRNSPHLLKAGDITSRKKVGIWLGCWWCKLTEILKWLNRCFFHDWSVSRGFRRHLIYLDICFSQRIYIIGQIETHRNCYMNELKLQTMTPEQFWFKSKQKESKWKQHQWSVMNQSTQLVKFWLGNWEMESKKRCKIFPGTSFIKNILLEEYF